MAIHTMRVPDTSLSQALDLQSILEKTLLGRFPQIEAVVGRVGTSEIATEPHPPSIGDKTIVMKPRALARSPSSESGSGQAARRGGSDKLLGSNYEFSQPIRMRFNHLLAGVFSDVAVKVFGDDMDVMLQVAGRRRVDVVRRIPGASHVKGRASFRSANSHRSPGPPRDGAFWAQCIGRARHRRNRGGRERLPARSSRVIVASTSSFASPMYCARILRRSNRFPFRCPGHEAGVQGNPRCRRP